MGNLPGKMNKKTLPGKKVNGSYHSICMELLKNKEYKAKQDLAFKFGKKYKEQFDKKSIAKNILNVKKCVFYCFAFTYHSYL